MDAEHDSIQRFTGLADVYARSRPDYPTEVLDLLERVCRLGPGAIVVDVGSGTGISSRWLAKKGWRVIGIEPNDEMRRQAEEETPRDGAVTYHAGTGEATGLTDACADLVTSAQAFHWLDAERALAEFTRILKPQGWTALIWNERDVRDPFTADFGRIIRASKESARTEDARQRAGEAFLRSPRFDHKQQLVFTHQQNLDEDSVIGRALSMSHVTREPVAQGALIEELHACFRHWQEHGQVVMKYETSVYLGQRPLLPARTG